MELGRSVPEQGVRSQSLVAARVGGSTEPKLNHCLEVD